MKFITPCFVRVEEAFTRDVLIAWCANIGYETNTCRLPPLVCYVFTDGDFAGRCGEKALGSLPTNSIDCGTDIELFKALAAMNDENDREQWFIEEGRMFKCMNEKLKNYSYHALYTRKATAEEMIEHFKNRQS